MELRGHRLELLARELAILVGIELKHPIDEAARSTASWSAEQATATATAAPSPFTATAARSTGTTIPTPPFGRRHGEDLFLGELAILVGIAARQHPLHPRRELLGGQLAILVSVKLHQPRGELLAIGATAPWGTARPARPTRKASRSAGRSTESPRATGASREVRP